MKLSFDNERNKEKGSRRPKLWWERKFFMDGTSAEFSIFQHFQGINFVQFFSRKNSLFIVLSVSGHFHINLEFLSDVILKCNVIYEKWHSPFLNVVKTTTPRSNIMIHHSNQLLKEKNRRLKQNKFELIRTKICFILRTAKKWTIKVLWIYRILYLTSSYNIFSFIFWSYIQ